MTAPGLSPAEVAFLARPAVDAAEDARVDREAANRQRAADVARAYFGNVLGDAAAHVNVESKLLTQRIAAALDEAEARGRAGLAAAAVAALSEAAVNASAGRLYWWADPARHEYRAADPARPEDGCASCGHLAHMHPNRRPAGDDPGGWRQQAVRLLLAIPDADDRAALVADALIAAYTRSVRHMADQLDGPVQGSDGLRDAANVAVEDVRAIAEALGIGGHARPYPAHEVVQREILPALRSLHAAEAAVQRVRDEIERLIPLGYINPHYGADHLRRALGSQPTGGERTC